MEFLQALPIAITGNDDEGNHTAGRGVRQLATAQYGAFQQDFHDAHFDAPQRLIIGSCDPAAARMEQPAARALVRKTTSGSRHSH